MNKKIIAIAVATAMSAPVLAADLKISGRINQQLTSLSTDKPGAGVDTDVLDYSDNGHQRLQFDVKSGDAYGRIAYDARTSKNLSNRDLYIGYKFGSSSIQFGRMGNSGKNIEKDPLIATFLEERSSVVAGFGEGSAYDSNGFVSKMAQYATKINGIAVKVQLGLGDNDAAAGAAGATNQGHVGVSLSGKVSGVRWFVSNNNGKAEGGDKAAQAAKLLSTYTDDQGNVQTTQAAVAAKAAVDNDQSITKIGASMKFGKVNTSLTLKMAEDNGTDSDAIVVRANMNMGEGLTGYFGYGINTFSTTGNPDVDATWLRLAVAKKLNKNTTLYGGYTSSEWDAIASQDDTSEIGVGMTIKF